MLPRDHFVSRFSDNQEVVSVVTKGSMKIRLQEISLNIFSLCPDYAIINKKADYLFKVIIHDDWGISLENFGIIEAQFWKISIDWFASEHTYSLPGFNSKFWNTRSRYLCVDAFIVKQESLCCFCPFLSCI
jgi:hypothetical protein